MSLYLIGNCGLIGIFPNSNVSSPSNLSYLPHPSLDYSLIYEMTTNVSQVEFINFTQNNIN